MHPIILSSPSAIFFQIGSVTIRWYGVIIALGFLAATHFATKIANREGINSEKLVNCALLSFLGGIIGARLYFVFLNWPHYAHHPEKILATWLGGMSIHGGLIGGLIFGIAYCLWQKMPIGRCMDIVSCCLPLAQAIGRWGNFFNSEAFGKPVPDGFPVCVFVPYNMRPDGYSHTAYYHATFLYESLWDFTIFLFLYYLLYPRLKTLPALTFCLYLGLYSLGRLLIEPMRTDSIMAGAIPVASVASIVGLVLSMCGAITLVHRRNLKVKTDTEKI